jgi:hypothetical protein
VPVDLRRNRDLADARRASQEMVGHLGEVLEAWPALADAAREITSTG